MMTAGKDYAVKAVLKNGRRDRRIGKGVLFSERDTEMKR
jgi:hypothetical protein